MLALVIPRVSVFWATVGVSRCHGSGTVLTSGNGAGLGHSKGFILTPGSGVWTLYGEGCFVAGSAADVGGGKGAMFSADSSLAGCLDDGLRYCS